MNSETTTLGEFELDTGFIHLNHGSYGAVPLKVRLEQDRWRARIERNPTGFLSEEYPALMRGMAQLVATRFGGAAGDWVFCENATAAVSSVLHSLPLAPGDEILTTSHAYGAVMKAMALTADRRGATLRIAELPPLIDDEALVVQRIGQMMRERTKLLVVDHITSPTATILPVARIAASARAARVPILIDGAHVPGHLPLDVPSLGADWYTGNAHKWLFAPRGCGVLWTDPKHQAITRPAVLSHGTDQDYAAAFDWIGTRDPSPWLSFEAAAAAHVEFGGTELMSRNRELVQRAAARLSEEFGFAVAGTRATRGAMAAMILKDREVSEALALAFRRALAEEHCIVAPVNVFGGKLWLRISAQIYNTLGDYDRLARALKNLMPRFAASQQ